jgi:carbonic anhydrase
MTQPRRGSLLIPHWQQTFTAIVARAQPGPQLSCTSSHGSKHDLRKIVQTTNFHFLDRIKIRRSNSSRRKSPTSKEPTMASVIYDEVISANGTYAASFGDKSRLALPPARRFAILTCMDARLDPAKYAGLAEGDAHVIRNAGGRASDDAIRSLVISHKLLGTREWFVVHHTDCGMQLFTGEIISGLLADNLETAEFDGKTWSNPKRGGGSVAGHYLHWHTFKDNAKSVTEDVLRIRHHPLVPGHIPIYGFIYDVKTGQLDEVSDATPLVSQRTDPAILRSCVQAFGRIIFYAPLLNGATR